MAIHFAVVLAALIFARKRRKTRWPFKDSEQLLRGPGEGLRQKILALDESMQFEIFAAVVVQVTFSGLVYVVATNLGVSGGARIVITLVAVLLVALVSAVRLVRIWKTRSGYVLGWYGERMAAEMLQPLQLQGYHVFHDVPAESGPKAFNIDHVVVGPTGVTAVEVKTRRKGNARPGYKEHDVSFDGSQLDWPWGYDRHGIEQAINEADWLAKWIHQRTGLKVAVKPVLTLPGWFVRESPSPKLRVVNPKILPDVIRGRGEVTLTPQQVDLIARQLEVICRNVSE